jgi:hypothetical protein
MVRACCFSNGIGRTKIKWETFCNSGYYSSLLVARPFAPHVRRGVRDSSYLNLHLQRATENLNEGCLKSSKCCGGSIRKRTSSTSIENVGLRETMNRVAQEPSAALRCLAGLELPSKLHVRAYNVVNLLIRHLYIKLLLLWLGFVNRISIVVNDF